MAIHAVEVRVPLARAAGCEVCLCEHGLLHLTVGGTTVQLRREMFDALCHAVKTARERLTAQSEPGCGSFGGDV